MREVDRLVDQLRRAHEGGAWHGPALFEVLDGLPAGAAAARPVPGAHSIWEIVRHLQTWHDVARRRLAGAVADPAPEEDWPPVGAPTDAAWAEALAALRASYERLADAVASLPEAALDLPVPGRAYTAYVLLHGDVQHVLYHAGQIALLRKLTG